MSMARLVSLGIVTALIACLGITFYQVIAPFLMPLFLAAMIALLCQPVLRYFLHRCKGRRTLAAGLSTAAIVGSVMLPLVVIVLLGVLQFLGSNFREIDSDTIRAKLADRQLDELRDELLKTEDVVYGWIFRSSEITQVDRLLLGDAELKKVEELIRTERPATAPGPLERSRHEWLIGKLIQVRDHSLQVMQSLAFKTAGVVGSSLGSAVNRTVDLLGAFVGALVALFVFTLALYYFFLDGPDMVCAVQALIPVEKAHQQELMQQFAGSVRAVVLATFLAAIGQGLATALALQCVGMGHFFLFAIIATFSALIPMAGTWLVWVPCALWLGFVDGSWGSATFLAVVGVGPIGMMDNVVRTWVLKNDTSLHPLLAFVSVLGGLQVMGLWGVFIGPIVACCLHSLIEIFNVELGEIASGSDSAADEAETQQASEVPQSSTAEPPESGSVAPAERDDTSNEEVAPSSENSEANDGDTAKSGQETSD